MALRAGATETRMRFGRAREMTAGRSEGIFWLIHVIHVDPGLA